MPDDPVSESAALSLHFAYDGLNITLLDTAVVDAPSPDSEDTGQLTDETGFWYEIRDQEDGVLWRHSAVHPIWFESEGPADDQGAMTWAPDAALAGAFFAQVPSIQAAATLALVGSPPPGAPPGPVGDLATFDISGGNA